MNTSYGVDAYRTHDLNISMKTSSGDTIEMNFANHQSSSLLHKESDKSSSTQMSFSSMQSFDFKVESNGISKQDQKEIDAFMQTAQPYIDEFLQELKEDAPKSPVTQLAHEIAAVFEPNKDRDENNINNVKTNIVKIFDKSLNKLELVEKLNTENIIEKIFKETQKLLEKTLHEFDNFHKEVYA